MRAFLLTMIVLLLAITLSAVSLITLSVEDFEFFYTEEALEYSPGYTEEAIIRTIQNCNLISVRVRELMLSRVRLLGVGAEALLDVHQREQVEFFVGWVVPRDTEVLLAYVEQYGRIVRLDPGQNTPGYIWLVAEYDDQQIWIMLNYLMILNGYAVFDTDPYFTEEYRGLFETAYTFSKENKLGFWGDRVLEHPPVEELTPATVQSPFDPSVYVTRYGERYHRYYCHHVSEGRIELKLSEAKEAGYTPCSVCNPPR